MQEGVQGESVQGERGVSKDNADPKKSLLRGKREGGCSNKYRGLNPTDAEDEMRCKEWVKARIHSSIQVSGGVPHESKAGGTAFFPILISTSSGSIIFESRLVW